MRILGIDPGTSRIGFGIIEAVNSSLKLVHYGVIEAKEKTLAEKISNFSRQFESLLNEFHPDLAAIERLYFAKNQKTAIDVAQARGALLTYLTRQQISILEYSPNEVKSQITGYGLADKKGVAKMVKAILKIGELPGYDDAIDALAIAIVAANHSRLR